MRTLRDDQTEALENLRWAIGEGHRRIVMQAPTGFGKTVLMAQITKRARERKKRVLITVPAISLVDQTVRMLQQQGAEDVGVMQAQHALTNWDMPVQVASVQTLMRRPAIPPFDFALIDECHRWFAVYEKWLAQGTPESWEVPVIGLSATPWTKGLGKWFAGPFNVPAEERTPKLIVASTTQELIDAGRLSPFKVFAAAHPDLTDVRTVAGDYHEGELAEAMQKGALVADTVDTWLRLGENRPTLCYAVDRAHAKHLQQKFTAAGVPCAYQDAFTKDDERELIRLRFHTGEIKVVCNVGTLTTGIDWDVRCISLCRPTKSDMLFVQIIGRGLRTAEGKDHCLILDHSDNHSRLGFVTDIDVSYTGLHEGKAPANDKRTDAIRLPKECKKCGYLRPPRVAACPNCGFKAEAVGGVETINGELRELKPRPRKAKKPWELEVYDAPGAPDFRDMAAKRQFYAELLGYAERHGYKPGWASNKYREKVGVWPAMMGTVMPSVLISSWTAGWIKYTQIRWAKQKRASEARAWGSQ